MRALIFHAPRRIVVEERADPAPAPGEVVLRTDAAGICASDLRVYRGEKHAAAGVIPGHEITGTIGAVGEGVDDVAPGERVAVYPIVACGRCDFCRRGLRNRCGSRRTLGYDLDGGIAEYVRLPAPIVGQGQLMPVPEGVPAERAAMTEPTACVLNSLESCRFRAGAAVAIIGAGPMGLTHVILARALGAGAIVVAEPVASRRAVAEALGATAVCGGDPAEIRQTVSDATRGAGAEVVIVSVGLDGLTELALPIAAKQGAINLFAGFPPETTAALDVNFLHYNEIVLTGSQNATADQFRRTAELLPSLGGLDRLTTHRFDMADAAGAYTTRDDPDALKTIVFPGGAPR
ncbi:MAG: alcohol dehydrogenase catalytic domain-containing protein [Chloroflexi bacterium]|nr:alcohol dehydrogenase catalytic domain-containing protein [Chloroflexota bacterium]